MIKATKRTAVVTDFHKEINLKTDTLLHHFFSGKNVIQHENYVCFCVCLYIFLMCINDCFFLLSNISNILGFTEGFIKWNDAGLQKGLDHEYNTMPAGNYYPGATQLEYCCREDGSTKNPIFLPTESPFYLIQYHEACQEVGGKRRGPFRYSQCCRAIQESRVCVNMPLSDTPALHISTFFVFCFFHNNHQ